MRARTRIAVLLAAGAGVALTLITSTPRSSPRAAQPGRPDGAGAAAALPDASAPGAPAALPLPPRAAALRPIPARAVPRAVQPGAPADAGPLPQVAPLPAAPAPSEWAGVEIVNPFGVGSPSPAVTKAIQATLRPRLAGCFERLAQAGWGGLGSSYSALAPLGEPSLGPAILVLEVEADGGGVTVVDAPVEARGSVSDGTLNCAQSVLRGAKLQARSEGKPRFRMRFALRR